MTANFICAFPNFSSGIESPQIEFVRCHRPKWVHTRLSEKDCTQRLTRRNRGLPSLVHSVVLCCRRYPFYSAMLLYTYISRFSVNPHYRQQLYLRPSFIVFFNFSHKRPTFAFAGKSEYTLGFAQRIAHNGSHAEIGAFRMGGWYHYPRSVPHVRKPPRAGCQNGKFCRFWVLAGGTPKERRKPSEQRCAYACRCSEASRPRWAAQLCCSCFDLL